MARWLEVFADGMLDALPADKREAVVADAVAQARAQLWDARQERWVVDYRRLRVVAVRLPS